MPRKAKTRFNEKDLTKGQLRKLTALRKSLGEDIADRAFAEWLQTQGQRAGDGADRNAERITEALQPLVDSGALSIPRGGYLLRRGRGRIIVERPE